VELDHTDVEAGHKRPIQLCQPVSKVEIVGFTGHNEKEADVGSPGNRIDCVDLRRKTLRLDPANYMIEHGSQFGKPDLDADGQSAPCNYLFPGPCKELVILRVEDKLAGAISLFMDMLSSFVVILLAHSKLRPEGTLEHIGKPAGILHSTQLIIEAGRHYLAESGAFPLGSRPQLLSFFRNS
jgi:hypothetical protein